MHATQAILIRGANGMLGRAFAQPWAIINASGYERVDEAERDIERCFRENVQGPALLASACAQHTPCHETDCVAPLKARRAAGFHFRARRPYYSALGSKRGKPLPSLDDALARYAGLRADPAEFQLTQHFAVY
jgi:hypothetical protein